MNVPEESLRAAAVTPQVTVDRATRIREILWLWFFASMATAAFFVNKMTLKQYVLHRFTWTSRDLIWMSPLANLMLLAVPALLLVALAFISPKYAPRWLAAFVLAVPAAIGMAVIVRGLENYAIWILAIGVGVQGARMLSSSTGDAWLRRIKIATIGLAALFAAVGIVQRGWRTTAEWRWLRHAAQTPKDAPNVLILLLDTVRAGHLSLYGYSRPTSPTIDSLARDATVFNSAYSTAGWTLPSHCSFFTGRYPDGTTCGWETKLGPSPRTVAEIFRDNGWRTGGFAGNLFYATHETGIARGFTTWEDFKVSFKQILSSSTLAQGGVLRHLFWNPTGRDRLLGLKTLELKGDPKPEVDRRQAEDLGAQFLDWADRDPERPFFAYVNFFDAHEPYEPPAAFRNKFVAEDPKDRDRYDGGIAYIDQEVGRILSGLQQRGRLDRTLVVIVGDHGEQFGEHNLTTHGNSLYTQLIHVPLIMRYPSKLPSGARVNRAVSLRDLPRTMLDVAGIADTKGIFGTSLVPAVADSAHETSAIIAETEQTPKWTKVPTYKGPMSSLMDQRYHYIRSVTGTEWLFDYRADPAELQDLVKDPSKADILAALREQLTTHRKPSNAASASN
ncbi:MAG: hypothetical protein MNPFHGCM_02074 [Gemmatimonadaceae bacterium]|nr:hypothetical protein [Gemmatimonadaceae bacterium]